MARRYDPSDYPTRQDAGITARWILLGFGLLCFIGVLFVIGRFAFGWFTAPADIYGRDNIQKQWQFAYDGIADLKATAQNVCMAERAVTQATNDTERTQRQSQLIAQQNNYTRQAAEYDGRLRDKFRANLIAPPDVPPTAPSLEAMKAQVGCNSGKHT